MSLRKLPEVKAFARPDAYQWDVPADVEAKYIPMAAEADSGATISLYGTVGFDYETGEGITVKRVAGALRNIGERPVEVLINTRGGDMFEGLAIYNLFREHPAEVTVKVMSLAASAGSIIAMAADKLLMARGSFLMIHNCWGVVMGNRNDLREAASVFDEFDAAMAEIYQARTGGKIEDIAAMMDSETFIRATEAVAKGFADGTTDDPAPTGDNTKAELSARRRLDAILAQGNMPRSERRKLLRELSGTHDAADLATHDAGPDLSAGIAALINTLRA